MMESASDERRVRIGIALHDFALGGTERIAVRLANSWSKAGADVKIFCGSEVGPLRALLSADVGVTAHGRAIRRRWGSVRRLARAAKVHFAAHRVDGLFVPGNYHWPIVSAIAGLPDVVRPRIVTQVSSALAKPQRGVIRQRWFEHRMRRLLNRSDHIVALSEETAVVARQILPAGHIVTIGLPALDDVACPPATAPPGPPLLVAAGRFVAQKDFCTLVDAFALLDHPTAELVIVGSGPQEAMIRARIAARRLNDRVRLVGYVADIRPWLDRSRLFVMSSIHEGYAAVIIEALGAGRQVVATDCTPAARELLASTLTGRVVPIRDPVALAGAIAAALAEPAPEAEALARLVDRFRIGPIASAYRELLTMPVSLVFDAPQLG